MSVETFETVTHRHLLTGLPEHRYRQEGASIADLVRSAGIDARFLPDVQVTISKGLETTNVPMSDWHKVRPRRGSFVWIGPGMGDPFSALLLSALLPSAAGYVAGTVFSLAIGSLGYALTYAAVTIVGSLLINALIPPPSRPEAATQDDPNFSITGSANAENRYGVYPTVLGRHLMYPPKTARGYTEGEGDNIHYRGRYTFGYGPVALESLRIGTTPITEFDGVEIEFLNVDKARTLAHMPALAPMVKAWRTRDATLSLYPDDITEDGYSVELAKDAGVVRTTRERTVSVSVDVTYQGLVTFDNRNQKQERSCEIKYRYRKLGAQRWTDAGTETHTGRSTAQLRFTKTIALPEEGEYDIEVTRLTEDSEETTVRDDACLSALRSVQAGALPSHGDIAEIAVRIKASDQINGPIEALNTVVHQMAPVWSGTGWSDPQPVRHPAWIYARALLGPMLGKPVAAQRLQLDDLKAWADGEPHWTCDAVIDQATTVAEVLDLICAAGRARRTLRDLKYSIIRDGGAGPVVQQFSPRNSSGFTGSITFPKVIHGFRVRCLSERLDWQQDEITVYADGFDAASATEFETLELRGVVLTRDDATGGNAWRLGRYHLAQAILRPEEFSWQCNLEHLRVNMGDKVRLVHDVPLIGVGAGRITAFEIDDSGRLARFVLDELMALDGDSYRVCLRRQSGEEIVFRAAPPASHDGLWRVEGAVADSGISIGDLVSIEEMGQESMEVLVRSIRHDGDLQATLTGVPAAPAVLKADQGRIPDYVPTLTKVVPRTTLAPARPVIQSIHPEVLYGPARVVARVKIADHDRFDTNRYHVALIDPSGDTQRFGPFLESGFDIPLASYGVYRVQLREENRTGLVSMATEVDVDWALSLTAPGNVMQFRADLASSHVTLTWNADDPAARHYELRYLPIGNDGGWSQAVKLASEVQGGTVTVPALSGNYLIRAVGYWGQQSKAAAVVKVSDISVFGLNVVKTLNEEPAFAGQKTGPLTLDGGLLLLGPNGDATGSYAFSEVVDLTGVYAARISADIHAVGYIGDFHMSSWPHLSRIESLTGSAREEAWAVRLMMQVTWDDPGADTALWSDWEEFRAGDTRARGFRFRLDITSHDASVLVAVKRLSVTVDMPDRVAGDNNIACPPTGIHVAFQPPFKERPAISVTGQELPSGAVERRTQVTNTGFHTQFVNASDTGVACTFDWVAVGYGRKT